MKSYSIAQHSYTAKTYASGLYIVSTPIGNLGDMTIRGLELLASADLIACEDTRVTGKLLSYFGIKSKMISYHEHNADKQGKFLIEQLKQGAVIALTSDAGTPLVSDPGQRLVASAKEAKISVFPVPGASAPLAAITASGFSTDRFTFFGFLPNKKGARQTSIKKLQDEEGTLVFFEGPSRLAACLSDMSEILGADREVAVCRELTKMHEEVRKGPLEEVFQHYDENPPKGEIVIVLAPKQNDDASLDVDAVLLELLETMPVSRAAGEAAKLTGRPKRDLYQRALSLKDNGNE